MNRVHFFCVAAVLLLTATVSADLQVHEYVSGQKVTFDENTGHYWYWNLADFVNKTYAEQNTEIASLGNYGYIADGWHRATLAEMGAIWNNYTGPEIAAAFGTSYSFDMAHIGWYDGPPVTSGGFTFNPVGDLSLMGVNKTPLQSLFYNNDLRHSEVGAWVTTNAPVVPVPPAVILAATGLLSSALGLKRCRRKR
jgi:hypothetical protein